MIKFIHEKRAQKGFTLIELLVVIAIIGILATIVLVSLNTARAKARDTRRASDLRQVALALELSYDKNSEYPLVAACADDNIPAILATEGFMSAVPGDPGNGAYQYAGTAVTYVLRAVMEDALPDNSYKTDFMTCTCTGALEYCIRP